MKKALVHAPAMYAADHAIMCRMLLLAQLDPEVAGDYKVRQQRRAESMRDLAHGLRRQRHLRAGVSAEAAAAVLWVLTSFETFDQLFSGWGLDATACGAWIVMMARSALLQPSG